MNVRAKFNNGAVHLGGHEFTNGRWSPACGMQHHNSGNRTPSSLYPTDDAVTCKRCLKVIERDAAKAQAEQASEIKPGRCLQRVGKVGANPTQCVKDHAHEDDHEDRFGDTYRNHVVVPGAEPLSPTAQALADASTLRDAAMKAAYEAEGTDREADADAAYQQADDAYHAAKVAHRAARIAAGDDVNPIAPRPERAADPEPFTFEYDALTGIIIADALREKAKTHRREAAEYRKAKGQLVEFYAEQARIADNNAKLLEDAADAIHAPVKAALAKDMAHAVERTEVKVRAEKRAKRAKREQTGIEMLQDLLKLS